MYFHEDSNSDEHSANRSLPHMDQKDNSPHGAEESAEEPACSDKESSGSSSDELLKSDASGQVYEQRRDKKTDKRTKSKVKIKTLTIDGQLVYFCKICDKIFTRRKDKLNHELAHSGESVLTCTECGKEYLHESSLTSHMRTHAGDPLYMCDLCPKMFAQSHHLKTHILSHSEPTNFVCKTCYTEFPTSSDLNHHNRVQSKLEMSKYWCKMCKVYFCRSHGLTCSTRLHAFCCSACNELFYMHKKLKIHMKKFAHYSTEKPKYIEPLQEHELYPDHGQDNQKKLQAQKENEVAKKQHKFDLHEKRQLEQDSEAPPKKFKLALRKLVLDGDQSSTSVQDSAPEARKEFHVELKSPTKQRKGKPYCKKCNRSFKDSGDLDRHKAMVHEDKQDSFTCDICSLGFSSKDELDRHGFKHTGERMHSCPVCGQEFPLSMQLTKHLRQHVGDFPYKCSQCGKAFRLKIQLIQHVRLHIAQDTKSSEKCPGSFPARDEHQDHLTSIHEGAGSFQCHLCSKKFSFRYKLLNHQRLHTNVKCFQCYVCHKTFATKHYLQRHLQVHVKQGLDVDVQNIIIDKDSKSELENMREQITKDNFKHREDFISCHHFDSFEKEDMRKSLLGIKKSVSNTDLAESIKDQRIMCDKNYTEIENCNYIIDKEFIKAEVQDDEDTASEHSFCSSFTRDSERSDPFKFSSDESYSFKTTMAKERRRLKRKWRKNRKHLLMSDVQKVVALKKSEDLHADDDPENGITDMSVELDAVRSECDNITTLYINLNQIKPVCFTKPHPPCVTETELSVKDKTAVSEFQQIIKDEKDDKFESQNSEAANTSPCKLLHSPQSHDFVANSGKMLMFELDLEQFLDGKNELFSDKEEKIISSKLNNEQEEETKTQIVKDKTELKQNKSEDSLSACGNLLSSTETSDLKIVQQESKPVSETSISEETQTFKESSNLEKLQAIFERSSKYLPLKQLTESQILNSPGHNKVLTHDKITDKKENDLAVNFSHHLPDVTSSLKSNLHDKHLIHISREVVTDSTSLPASQNGHNSLISDQQPGLKSPVFSSKQAVIFHHETESEGLMTADTSVSSKPSLAAPESVVISSKCVKNILTQGDSNPGIDCPQRGFVGNADNCRHMHDGGSLSSQVFPDINNSNLPMSLMPQACNVLNVANSFPQPLGQNSSSLIMPSQVPVHSHVPVLSQVPVPSQVPMPSTLYHNPVIGNTGSDLNHLQSRMGVHIPSFVNVCHNSLLSSAGTRNVSTDNAAFTSGCGIDLLSCSANPPDGRVLPENPLVTPSCVIGLNTPVNQNLNLATNWDSFSLNPSAIFDSSNPVYRDMNMMDLVSVPPAQCTQNMAARNLDLLRQDNIETQMKFSFNMESQGTILQPQNPVLNLENPVNFGNLCTPLSHVINQAMIPMNCVDNQILSVGLSGAPREDRGSLLQARNIFGAVCRDNMTDGNAATQFPMHVNQLGVPVNATNILSLNNLNSLGALRSSSFSTLLPAGAMELGGSFTTPSIQTFNQASLHCDIPLSCLPSSSHVINNLSSGFAPFSSSVFQNSLGSIIAAPGINLLNSSLVPQNSGTLPGPSLSFVSSGFFPKF